MMGLVENVNNCSQKNVTMSIKSKIILLGVFKCWAAQLTIAKTIPIIELNFNQKINKDTVSEIFIKLRQLCAIDIDRLNLKLGGPSKIVEIDESLYAKVKHNKDDDNSDIGSLLGSLISSRSNSEVDPNEFGEENGGDLQDVDIHEIGESEDDKTESVTLVKSKSDDTPIDNQDSDAELSFSENLITIDKELSVLNLNAGEKAIHYREKAMTEITTSQETLNV
ncbi:hypothetical protein BpHYR1_019861, partial [Brachionus plicatilis]